MSKHGETEKFIEKLFKEKGEFVFGGEKLNIVKIGKPRLAKGECKTDLYILATNEKSEEKEIKISIKQSDADFLENYIARNTTVSEYDLLELLEKEDIEKIQIDLDIQDDILEETMINNTNLEHYIIN